MNKILLLSSLLLSLSFFSCKKNRSCSCDGQVVGTAGSVNLVYFIPDSGKRKAKQICADHETATISNCKLQK